MKYQVTLNGKNYEVEVEKGEAEVISVAEVVAVSVAAPAAVAPAAAPVAAAPSAAPAASGSGEPVNAPMPGTVLEIKVAAGEAIKKDQVILILEAMKMENEIVSPRDGVVSSIAAEKGSSIAAGTVLLYLQ